MRGLAGHRLNRAGHAWRKSRAGLFARRAGRRAAWGNILRVSARRAGLNLSVTADKQKQIAAALGRLR